MTGQTPVEPDAPGVGPTVSANKGGDVGSATRRHRNLLWIVLGVALVLRLVAFVELSDGPAAELNGFRDSDMAFFNAWSLQISRGELLSEEGPGHPVHSWHMRVADSYFSADNERLGGREWSELSDGEKLNATGLLWNNWYGGGALHQEPLYPYLMALVYGIVGNQEETRTWPIQILQMLVGVATIALLYQVTRIYFGSLIALVAAILAAAHAPLLHYEFFLLRTGLIGFAGLLLVYLGERTRGSTRRLRWLGYGVWCGLAAALKLSFVLFGLIMCLYLLWPQRRQLGLASRRLGLWGLGMLLALSPIFLRNLLVGAPLFGITSIGPVTFAVSNHAGYVANTNWTVDPEAVAQIMGESGGGFLSTITATLATHDGVGSYLGLLWAKFAQVWQWLEVPNNTNFYLVREISWVLTWLPVTFTLVACLGLVGLGAAMFRKKFGFPLLMLIAVALVQMVGFYVLARFRLPMTLALLPFSALGLVELWRGFRDRRWLQTGGGLLAAILFAVWIQRPMDPDRPVINSGDYVLAHLQYYVPQWNEAAREGDWARAADVMRRAIELRPDYLDGIDLSLRRIDGAQFLIVRQYADTYSRYATSLENLGGQVGEATKARTRAGVLTAIARAAVPQDR